jgi:anti-sigma regulatory factor (Ser/Thr protein kinase)
MVRITRSNRSQNERNVDLIDAERRFKRSCEQIVLLNQALKALQKRYDDAKRRNLRAFRYHLRLRLAVIEGMRNVYYEYAHEKAKKIAELRRELFGEIVEIVSEDANET